MSRAKFELLLQFLHFSNNDEQDAGQDRLAKLNPLLHLLKARFKSIYIPGSVVTVDETMVPWWGRLSFRQYVPGKALKYGVKMYRVADTDGYTWDFIIYTGKQNLTNSLGRSRTVIMQLLEGLFGRYRTVVADNFLTSIALSSNDCWKTIPISLERWEVFVLVPEKKLSRNNLRKVRFVDYRMVMILNWSNGKIKEKFWWYLRNYHIEQFPWTSEKLLRLTSVSWSHKWYSTTIKEDKVWICRINCQRTTHI